MAFIQVGGGEAELSQTLECVTLKHKNDFFSFDHFETSPIVLHMAIGYLVFPCARVVGNLTTSNLGFQNM